jgi:hypothetical protein
MFPHPFRVETTKANDGRLSKSKKISAFRFFSLLAYGIMRGVLNLIGLRIKMKSAIFTA